MGFYGNITSSSKTQFSFDRIYPNRRKMEENMVEDGIYMGRFVLIDYDQDISKNEYRLFYYENGRFFMFAENAARTEVRFPGDVAQNEIIRVTSDINKDNTVKDNAKFTFYKCTGGNKGIAQFKKIADAETNYTTNYQIDTAEYGEGRGWDSTVWQKVYTQGISKYVMIAELNAVVPTFDIVPDAPSLAPIAPHFDPRSNNVYYKLHYQPQWGMRVKSAGGIESDKKVVPSDEEIIWKKEIYNAATDEETIQYFDGKKWGDAVNGKIPTHEGAIYYNKAGFEPEVISYNSSVTDKVAVEATGISGTLYNDHNGANPTVYKTAEDIQEISIILPSIGNSIAEMWNIVYGDETDNAGNHPVDETGKPDTTKIRRNMDVSWDSYEGHRLVKELVDGSNNSNGFTYDKSKVNTLAGAINSVHDLMGMIIYDGKVDNISELNADNVFYNEGKYYRKAKDYSYTEILNSNSVYSFEEITLTKDTYKPNIYYLDQRGLGADIDGTFKEGQKYYQRILNAENIGTEVELVGYEPNKYYYKNLAEDYILGGNEYNEDKIYFDVTFGETTIDREYEPNRYYKRELNPDYGNKYKDKKIYNYVLETAANSSEIDPDTTYFEPEFAPFEGLVYEPNKYYYYHTSGEEEIFLLDSADKPTKDRQYYRATVEKIGDQEITMDKYPDDETRDEYVTITIPLFRIINKEEVFAFNIEDGFYYPSGRNFVYTEKKIEGIEQYYTVFENDPINSFYIPNRYYYKYNDTTWKKDKGEFYTEGRHYYIVTTENRISYFYEPRTYYYWDGKEYILDNSVNMTPDRKYFLGEEYYVLQDISNVFLKYSLWNNNVKLVPCAVTLGTREEFFTLKELVGFARSLNTIHGLILETNKLLEINNEKIRELDTVQGSINKLNDIIYKFERLVPKDILIIDSYGRAHGASHTTAQEFKYTNIGLNSTGSKAAEEDRWIYLDVDPDVVEPEVIIKHKFTAVEDTISGANKNDGTSAGFAKPGLNASKGDSILLYTPIVDNMGHVVGKNTETVILPFGYKTIKAANTADTVVNAPASTINTNGQIADNTQDTLTFNASNRWIKLDNNTEDTVKIGHKLSVFEAGSANTKYGLAKNTSAEDLDGDNTFEVPYFRFDEAGHIDFAETHTVELPEGFGKVAVANSGKDFTSVVTAQNVTIEADSMADTVTIDAGNRWIRMVGDSTNDKITIYHNTPNPNSQSSNTTKTGNETPNFGATFEIPEVKYDEAGHIFNVGTHTVKVPQPSLNSLTTTNASVITELSLTAATGAFSQSSKNVGDLVLTGYVKPANGVVESTDNINGAFKKLQEQIIGEISNREAAITKEVSDRNTAITNAINTEVTNRNTAITNAINTEVTNRNNAISTAVNAEAIERNNAISAAKTEITGGATEETIISLLRKINTLQNSYNALLARVEELEAYHNEENT